jgi:hypothetical protein
MRQVPGWVWGVTVAVALVHHGPAPAAGVWVTLAAGLPGTSAPSAEADLWFDSPHAPPFVAVTSVPEKVEAGTAGGTTSFGGLATPVLLNLSDGSAYIAGGASASDDAKGRGPKGGNAGSRASAAPMVNATVPDTATLLGINLTDPDAAGARDLTATFTDSLGNILATGTVTVPEGGYYVLGLGPDANPTPTDPVPTDPVPTDPTPTDPTPTDPTPTDPVPTDPVPTDPLPTDPTDSPVATPEPSTLALVTLGGLATTALRRIRGRKSA